MTYYVGLDLAKYKHDCFVMDENGEVIRDSFSFSNDVIGFNTLLNALNTLDPRQEKRIGLEATGHYGSNLKIFLERNGYSFMEFNSLLVYRHFKSETLRRTKNDKVDARMISSYLYTKEYKPNPNSSYHLNCLKSLTRLRESVIDERSLQLIRITNIMDASKQDAKQVVQVPANYSKADIKKQVKLDITGLGKDTNFLIDQGRSWQDVKNMAGVLDGQSVQDYMTVMSNTMSEEDYAKMCEEGFKCSSEMGCYTDVIN